MPGELVSIKGTRQGLVILLDTNRDYEDLKKYLQRKMESARGFFRGARFTVYGQENALPGHQRTELENICRQYGLIPDRGIPWPPRQTTTLRHPGEKANPAGMENVSGHGEPARLYSGLLRSGQTLHYPENVIILGDVHPGARVVAGGSIVVMGSCLGEVHAGAGPQKKATITALHLSPTGLSIAGIMADPAGIPQARGVPLMARVEKGIINFIFYQKKTGFPLPL
ncbi:septum site-determining protein MinC [Desulfofundulus thermobenzoicus]|uniref:Probable septum site-determining protein MinC n=1 Tax=Desulfofundulus thermobenzoicus TaxID=29376 RepID=A0A6N7IW64_9FIRM|nr:septum site-determining protein MinC [Desulfofundulus thermobenzoicus]HHW42381.1 septum site-determining protein MinC [Desulfotomaculum sp.]